MLGDNTSKPSQKACSEALNESEGVVKVSGVDDKEQQDSGESEGLKEFIIEVKENHSKPPSPNNLTNLSPGPMFDEVEIERREEYLFNNYLR